MKEESEEQTRKNKIDVFLREQGWRIQVQDNYSNNNTLIVSDIKSSYGNSVLTEIDTKQSDFKARDYKTISDTLRNDKISRYADYLLLDKKGWPLAIIEAKRTSKDPILGQKQAEQYAKDIFDQTKKPVFIFLTNGYETWFYNWNYPEPFENPRMIKDIPSQEALERKRFQNENKKKLSELKINEKIINRPYQIEAVKRVLEGIEKGKRKFLIVQATGTGKTRVAIAIINILLRSNRVQKVLFLADRKALRDQAYNSLKEFLPEESRDKIFSGKLNKNVNLYTSTIQTFMECYREFSPGDFDLIISDEAHRSIYNKWKDVFTYFDAIQIGLTATPSDWIERDTFRFFECEDNSPTTLYSYEQAIKDKWLADFKTYGVSTHFQMVGIKPKDIPKEMAEKLKEKGVEEDELNFEGTDIEKRVIITGTNEAIVKEFMENCLKDKTGTLPAKSIFFAISKKHAKRILVAFEKLYPEYKGQLAKIIISEDSRAQDILDEFKKENFPRVAISVDMLDTGVDVPEVCNLVFAKPVFSKIKFWQMIGRGTRSDKICKHKDWLPEGKKEYFLIFDFWKNMEWFNLHPEGKELKPIEALPSKIFFVRVQQYENLLSKNKKSAELLKKKIIKDIEALPKNSVSVREKAREIELVTSGRLWNKVGVDPVKFLKTKITPLMKYQKNVNLDKSSFTLKVERLALAILNNNTEGIDILKEDICRDINCLPLTIDKVKQKKEFIDKVTNINFWKNIKFNDATKILEELEPLMIFKRPEPVPKMVLDIDDVVQERKLIEFGPEPSQEYVEVYKNKVEKRIKDLAEKNRTIKKIKNNEILTEEDLENLEKTLNSPELYITEEVLQDVYDRHKGTLVEFLKEILNLRKLPNYKEKVKEAFKTYMVENNYLKANQVNFLRTLQTLFIAKQHIEYKDFFEVPLTNIGEAPMPLFNKSELKDMLGLCNKLETQIFRGHQFHQNNRFGV